MYIYYTLLLKNIYNLRDKRKNICQYFYKVVFLHRVFHGIRF